MTLGTSTLLGLLVFSVSCQTDEASVVAKDGRDGASPNDRGDGSVEETRPPDVTAPDTPDIGDTPDTTDTSDAGNTADSVDAALPFDPGTEPCAEVDAFAPVFGSQVARFNAQDELGGWPERPVVFVGSSSIRRWETLAREFSGYSPLQRGLGGIQLGEVAYHARALITRHAPRAVVIFAGTNDIDAGVPVEVVIERARCLRWRAGDALGWETPVLFIAVTPTPARWSQWPRAQALHAAIAALAEDDPGLIFVDPSPLFLATGEPPVASLFDGDRLHLSPAGYALWTEAIRPALAAHVDATPPAGAPGLTLTAGTRVLIDLGPTNPPDGEVAPSPDHLGQHWNHWHPLSGGFQVLAGEQRVDLVTSTGAATGIDLVVAGGFRVNGRRNGGLLWPDAARLGDLAVGSATGDFLYTENADDPAALFLRGLDPERTYTLRLFAAREDPEVRVTRYTVQGATTQTATLQTSGPGAGAAQAATNDDTVVTLTGVRPDAWGHVFIDIAIEAGRFAYLSVLELVVE